MDYIYSGCIFKTENKLVNYRTFVEIVHCFSIVHKDFLLIVHRLMQDIGTRCFRQKHAVEKCRLKGKTENISGIGQKLFCIAQKIL